MSAVGAGNSLVDPREAVGRSVATTCTLKLFFGGSFNLIRLLHRTDRLECTRCYHSPEVYGILTGRRKCVPWLSLDLPVRRSDRRIG